MNSKIKWVKNSKVRKNPKISSTDILDKESDAEPDDVVVSMMGASRKYPTINVKFSRSREGKKRREKNTAGKWITKSWTDCPNVIASINTQEGYIHFNRSRIKQSELRLLMDVVDTVCENRPLNMVVETV